MCGIAGIASDGRYLVDGTQLDQITKALAHRGPDGHGSWLSGDGLAGFGHRRLSIIDPDSRSDQPMLSVDGRFSIIFNGEIYNFKEIREQLVKDGVLFRTDGDTEVLLEAWKKWQWNMLTRLNGMWAFAIRDNVTRTIFLARDRFGVKPLVYAETHPGLIFASETRALLSLPSLSRQINQSVASRALFDPFAHEASEFGLFSAVRKLPAGHCAEYRDGKLTVRRWWNTLDHIPAAPASLEIASEQFREILFDAVKLRMRADVPIGTCLSGGFDSTAVVCAMAYDARTAPEERQSRNWRHAFVASFPGLAQDETDSALLAAHYAEVQPHLMNFANDDGLEHLEDVLAALDDIYISLPTAIWKTYRGVCGSGIKVTLDGHGADELFGGYRTANKWLFMVRNQLGAQVGRGGGGRMIADRIRRHWFDMQGKFHLRTPLTSAIERFEAAAMNDRIPSHWTVLDRRLYGMFHVDILPTLLRNYDRLSMAHGVEIRMPFMDWRLATFIMSLPARFKVDGQFTKLAARHGMKGYMPEQIRTSPRKIGFSSQMPDWMNGSLGAWAQASLGVVHPAFEEMVDLRSLRTAIVRRNSAKSWDWSSSNLLWPYINLNWYLKRYG